MFGNSNYIGITSEKLLSRDRLPEHQVIGLIKKAQAGCGHSHDQVILTHTRFVAHMLKEDFHVSRRSGRFDDLFMAGIYGLEKAIRRFNVQFRNPFLTYASYWVRREIQEEWGRLLAVHGVSNRTCRRIERNHHNWRASRTTSDDQSEGAFIEQIGRKSSRFVSALALKKVARMRVGPGEPSVCDDVLARLATTEIMEKIWQRLKPQEASLLRRKFGVGRNIQTYASMSKRRRVSRQAIQQQVENILRRLRKELRAAA